MFRELVKQEKIKSREENGTFNSMHEVYGVLAEEVDEFFDEVKKKPDERLAEDTLQELVQIASVAEMAAEDLRLVDTTNISIDGTEENVYKKKCDELVSVVAEFLDNAVVGVDYNNRFQRQRALEPNSIRNITVKAEFFENLVLTWQNISR